MSYLKPTHQALAVWFCLGPNAVQCSGVAPDFALTVAPGDVRVTYGVLGMNPSHLYTR